MEKLIILRIFFCFPLVGLLLPDAGIWLSNRAVHIPLSHLLMEGPLIIFIAICSVMINVLKKRENNPVDEHAAFKL
jgi:hypothetical protein